MKHYYLRSILKQINSAKKENIIVIFLMILICSLLTISNIISDSDQLEQSLIQNTNFDIQIVNDNIYSDRKNHDYETYKIFYSAGKKYLLSFVKGLDDLAKQNEVSNYNYNLICPAIIKIGDDYFNTKSLIGINDEEYASEREIKIISGRMLSKEEIDEGQYKVIIPNNISGYDVGDKIKIYKTNDIDEKIKYSFAEIIEIVEVEIVGIYDTNNSQRHFSDRNDYFDNYSYILISNEVMKKIISEQFDNIYPVLLNDVYFKIDNYSDYVTFYDKYKELLIKNENDLKAVLDGNMSDIHNQQQNYEYILYSIQRIKLFYKIVFVVMTVLAMAILYWLNYYILSNKIKEINIFYSLGESKGRLVIRYMLMYIIILIIALIFGLLLGYGLSQLLQKRIFDNYIQIGKALYVQNIISENELVNISLSTIVKMILNVSIQAIVSTMISIMIVMGILLRGNIRDKLQKGI